MYTLAYQFVDRIFFPFKLESKNDIFVKFDMENVIFSIYRMNIVPEM